MRSFKFHYTRSKVTWYEKMLKNSCGGWNCVGNLIKRNSPLIIEERCSTEEFQEFRRAWLFLVILFLFSIAGKLALLKSAYVLIVLFTEVRSNYFKSFKDHSMARTSSVFKLRGKSYIRWNSWLPVCLGKHATAK